MPVHTYFPPNDEHIPDNEPLLFLAGPIQGAPNWQAEAVDILSARQSAFGSRLPLHVANPRREYLDGTFDYAAQVAWEKRHIQRAAKFGTVLFWFAKQDPSVEYEAGRAYAQTSRVELGRVVGWKDYAINLNLVIGIGIEPGYSGSERYFKTCADEQSLPIYDSLDATLEAATKIIFER